MPPHAVLIDRRAEREEKQKLANSIDDRLSEELIFALVGPVGSGVSTAGKYIAEILTQDYDYAVAPVIKPSDIIRTEAHRVGKQNIALEPLSTYIEEMQTAGNELRQKFGPNYLAEKAVERIVKFRRDQGGYGEKGIRVGFESHEARAIRRTSSMTDAA